MHPCATNYLATSSVIQLDRTYTKEGLMATLKGRLEFLGWTHRPWKLVTGADDVDLWPLFESAWKVLNGREATMDVELDSFVLRPDPSSPIRFQYRPGQSPLLVKKEGFGMSKEGFGMSNVAAYLEEALVSLDGRQVEVSYEIGQPDITIAADPTEEVFGLYFTGEGNSCAIPQGAEQTICKIDREADACIFVLMGADGFSCKKFNGPMARVLLDRLAKSAIRARRIGNCALLGRKEPAGLNIALPQR